jgi:hypothetical protein
MMPAERYGGKGNNGANGRGKLNGKQADEENNGAQYSESKQPGYTDAADTVQLQSVANKRIADNHG